jgi:predicted amidohydrolase
VALGQLRVDGGQPKVNLKRAVDMIIEAGKRGCDIIVLPECLDLGWTDASAHNLAQPIPGEHSKQLCEAARSAAIHVVAGLVERDGDALYNSAILISAGRRNSSQAPQNQRVGNRTQVVFARDFTFGRAHGAGLSWHHDLRR